MLYKILYIAVKRCAPVTLFGIVVLAEFSTPLDALTWTEKPCSIHYCGKNVATNELVRCSDTEGLTYLVIVQGVTCSFFEQQEVPVFLGGSAARVACDPAIDLAETCEVVVPSALLGITVESEELKPGVYEASFEIGLHRKFGEGSWPFEGQILVPSEATAIDEGSLFIADVSESSRGPRTEIDIPSRRPGPEIVLTNLRSLEDLALEWEFELTGEPWAELTLEAISRLDRKGILEFQSMGLRRYRIKMPGYRLAHREQRIAVELRLSELPEPVYVQLVLRSSWSSGVWIVLTFTLVISFRFAVVIMVRRRQEVPPSPRRRSVLDPSPALDPTVEIDAMASTDEAADVHGTPMISPERFGESGASSVGGIGLSPSSEEDVLEVPVESLVSPSEVDEAPALLQALGRLSEDHRSAERGDKRSRVNYVFMVDISGSMAGRPIEVVRWALKDFIDDLEEDDIVGIGTYDDAAEEVLAPQRISDRRQAINEAVDSLNPGGGTRLVEGLRVGLDMVLKRHDQAERSRLFLLSDGGGGFGSELQLAEEAKRQGIQVSTLGFGSGVNDRLLRQIAQTTGGRYEFVEKTSVSLDIDA